MSDPITFMLLMSVCILPSSNGQIMKNNYFDGDTNNYKVQEQGHCHISFIYFHLPNSILPHRYMFILFTKFDDREYDGDITSSHVIKIEKISNAVQVFGEMCERIIMLCKIIYILESKYLSYRSN